MITTSFTNLDSPEQLRSILAERGYFSTEAPAGRLFDLPIDQIGLMQGAQIVALAGPAPDDNTLVVLWVPRLSLPLDVLRRIRRRLAENTRDGLIFCAQSWQKATLYLLRQEDIAQAGSEPPVVDKVPTWELNFSALRPADRQGLAMLDLSEEDPYELGKTLLRAFRRAARETLYQNQGLFSNYYLNERLEVDNESHNAAWRALATDMPTLRPHIDTALAAGAVGLDLAQTEALIIRPLLQALGWQPTGKIVNGQVDLRLGGVTVAFCHMLPWGTPLDVASLPGDLLAPLPPSPDMQLIGRLSDQKSVLWGILTNGRIWRLISRQATSTSGVFYEIDLQDLLEVGAPDDRDLRWFVAFFSAAWLRAPGDQPGLLNVVYQSGQFWAEKLGNDLKKAIFKDVFVDLANALAEGVRRTGSEPHLPTVYRATLVLLYRLLFVLYAESRRLLPLSSPGYYPNSLTYMLSTLALKQNALMPRERDFSLQTDDPRLWLKLRALFSAIAEGNSTWNVPHYNGGLFADDTSPAHELLASLDGVANDYLTKGLDRLARDEDARGAQTEHGALRLIDYMDLDVRRLGSIYEGLLEFQLRRAEEHGEVLDGQLMPVSGKKGRKNTGRLVQRGEVYLATTREDRKASGSYYTPDYIVRYIVEQTVGPALEQRGLRFGEAISKLLEARTQLRRAEQKIDNPRYDLQDYRDKQARVVALEDAAVEALLDLKILDPAMGSGHFLVAAVNYLSDQIIAILQRYPENPVLPKLAQVRTAIRKNLDEQGISGVVVPDDQLSDRVLLRRMVMKRCIYGVDLNDMAVELAKLSLWLDSFAVGAPLSFLDHHLRWGNSLIGVWDAEVDIHSSTGLWQKFMRALSYMVQVTRLTDSTNDEVQESKELYEKAQAELRPFRERFNVKLAKDFVNLGTDHQVAQAQRVARDKQEEREGKHVPESIAKFELAQQEAEARRFFHWKIEFPEVFVDPERSDWKADGTAGFDVIVGNPPYANMQTTDHAFRKYAKHRFSAYYRGKADIYYYFMALSNDVIGFDRTWSLITARYFIESFYADNLWDQLTKLNNIPILIDFGQYKVFEDPSVDTSIIFASKISYTKNRQNIRMIKILSPRISTEDVKDILSKDIVYPSKDVSVHIVDIKKLRAKEQKVALESMDKDIISVSSKQDSFTKMKTPLNTLCHIGKGAASGLDEVFVVDEAIVATYSLEKEVLHRIIEDSSIERYHHDSRGRYFIVAERGFEPSAYPNVLKYLLLHRDTLEKRYAVQNEGVKWYEVVRYNKELFDRHSPQIYAYYRSAHSKFSYSNDNLCSLTTTFVMILKNGAFHAGHFLLSLLNSKYLERSYFYKGKELGGVLEYSSNQLQNVPIRRIHFTTPEADRKQLGGEINALAVVLIRNVQEMPLSRKANGWPRYEAPSFRTTTLGQRIAALLPQDMQGNFLAFAEGATGAEEHSDVVHDLLAELAGQMIALNKQKQAEVKRFLGWLEEQLEITTDKDGPKGIDSLANKTTLQNYLGDYQKNEEAQAWDSFFAVLHKNRRRFVNDYWVVGDRYRLQIKAEYEKSLATLLPIKERLARTDALIDQIVYQLYGLTLADIAVVEGG